MQPIYSKSARPHRHDYPGKRKAPAKIAKPPHKTAFFKPISIHRNKPHHRKITNAGQSILPIMQYIWYTNEFAPIYYDSLICHTKTYVSSLHYRGKIYYRSYSSIILGVSQEKGQ